jgi:hypothetical protein
LTLPARHRSFDQEHLVMPSTPASKAATAPKDSRPAGRPSELAERVTRAFRIAAKDAVEANRERGTTVVGEVNGQWRTEKKAGS